MPRQGFEYGAARRAPASYERASVTSIDAIMAACAQQLAMDGAEIGWPRGNWPVHGAERHLDAAESAAGRWQHG